MPSLDFQNHDVPGVAAVAGLLDDLLRHAETVKPTASIEPALARSDFVDLSTRLAQALAPADTDGNGDLNKGRRFAIIETVARDKFSNLIATTSIDSPDFVRVWNLFDILSILSDSGSCEPALPFWLFEELLDSQTIAGCRTVFDFLESRRERITSKHFEQKKLVILRTCNELLRRLSRAEDTAFCGRVFIFMFQSFPLGDKSSVNLRGEYHVENETTFDNAFNKEESSEKMDVDTPSNGVREASDLRVPSKTVASDGRTVSQLSSHLDPDLLYPVFWGLQSIFSQPKKLFDATILAQFKTGLEATMATFSTAKSEARKQEKQDKQGDDLKRSPEKREEDGEDELAQTFNPKYLTSRDLFELEISDMSFRRNILVQALIALDFLLSLSPKAKEKLNTAKVQNKSVMYPDQVLSEDDTKWAYNMKKTIGDYIKGGHPIEGPYFLRMVESVLTRDKNWIRWKVENCPSIEMPRISPQQFNEAKAVTRKMATNKRPFSAMGTLSLDFLTDDSDGDVMKKFRSKDRCEHPDLMSFRRRIADDDFEIEMPTNNQSKAAAVEGKSSKSWRALRIASRYKLASFDRIDNPEKIDAVFEEGVVEEPEEAEADPGEAVQAPDDRRAVVLVGPSGIGKSSLIRTLLENNAGVFEKVPAHVTRKADTGERDGRDYHFVDMEAFSMIRDADEFLQFTDTEGINYATSRRLVDAVTEAGKVPLLVMDHEGAQQAKDYEYAARFVFVKPSSADILETRLKEKHTSSEGVIDILKRLPDQLKHADSSDFYDEVIIGDNLEEAYESLRGFIYGVATNGKAATGEKVLEVTAANKDEAMPDASDNANASSKVTGTNGTEA